MSFPSFTVQGAISSLPDILLSAGFLFDAIDYLTYYSLDKGSILFSLKDWIMFIDWRSELAREGHRVILSGLPIAMHCHHYNINLQKMLEDTLGEEGIGLLYNVAEEVSYYGFRSFLDQYTRIKTIKSKLEFASTIYQNCGLGILHFKKAGPRGGRIVSPSSHHVTGWLAKHGRRDTPGCHFARGWIAGVMEVIYNRPLKHFTVEEQHCKMKRDEECVFHVRES